jgi:tetratricopeptide (TPR) repeat protein
MSLEVTSIAGGNEESRGTDVTTPDGRQAALHALVHELAVPHLPRALAQARLLLDAYPQDPEVLTQCGKVFLQAGQWGVARDAFRAALVLGGDNGPLHEAAGRAAWLLGDWPSAVAHFDRASMLGPRNADLEVHLASALLEWGRPRAAQDVLRRVVRKAPERADARRLLGRAARSLDQWDEALAHYEAAIARAPEHGSDYVQLGELLEELGRLDEAIRAYRDASEVLPNDAEVWLRLGGCFQTMGLAAEAEWHYEQAVRVNPGNPEAYVACGNMYCDTGRIEEAREYFRHARQAYPGFVPARIGEATLLERIGEDQEALKGLTELRRDFPKRPPLLLLAARLAKSPKGREASLGDLEACLAELPPHGFRELRSLFQFASARLCDRLERYTEAFRYFQAASAWRRRVKPFSREHIARDLKRMKTLYIPSQTATVELTEQRDERRPIFLVGMPRSGTSLAEQILASHPDVYGAGELGSLNEIITEAEEQATRDTGEQSSCFAIAQLQKMQDAYWEKLPEGGRQSVRVTDKMPHNFRYVGLILAMFPESKVIHCCRHPLDTALSCFMQNFAEGNAYSHDLGDCGFFYRQYADLMDHWRSVFGEPFFELRYEVLVSNPESTVRALLDYCGLEWNDACLRFHENKRVVHTASYKQVREPFYTRSIGRWRHYAAYLRPLVEELGGLVSEEDRAYVLSAAEKAGTAGEGASQAAIG